MMKYKHSVKNIIIESGTDIGTASVTLKEGEVVACALYKDVVPSAAVDIKIEDSQGDELHPLMTYKDFEPGDGNYLESRKPLSLGKHRQVEIIAKASASLTAKVSFQMIFYIKEL